MQAVAISSPRTKFYPPLPSQRRTRTLCWTTLRLCNVDQECCPDIADPGLNIITAWPGTTPPSNLPTTLEKELKMEHIIRNLHVLPPRCWCRCGSQSSPPHMESCRHQIRCHDHSVSG